MREECLRGVGGDDAKKENIQSNIRSRTKECEIDAFKGERMRKRERMRKKERMRKWESMRKREREIKAERMRNRKRMRKRERERESMKK